MGKMREAANDNAGVATGGGRDQRRPDYLAIALQRGEIGRPEEAAFLARALDQLLEIGALAASPESTGNALSQAFEAARLGLPPSEAARHDAMRYQERYARAHQILRYIKKLLGPLWQPLVDAIGGASMQEIGLKEGKGKQVAAAVGCARVAAALRQLDYAMLHILESEASEPPLTGEAREALLIARTPMNDNTPRRVGKAATMAHEPANENAPSPKQRAS